jgi:hypothetical protein
MSKGWLNRWFADRLNREVLDMVQRHLRLTEDAVEELYNMVCIACETEPEKEELYRRVADLEKEADQIRRDMVDKLTERDIYPTEREDLMELVRAVDWIADWAREAGRILLLIPFEKSPEEMKISVRDMCKDNVACVKALAECIRTLPRNGLKAIDLSNRVEMLEEEIDELYSICRKNLADLDYPDYSTGSMILLNEFLDSIEMMADWCENTADIVRAVAVRIQ